MTGAFEQGGRGSGRLVTVFGGTGFLGRRIVAGLMARGFAVRTASRHPERASMLFRPDGRQPETVRADVREESSLAAALSGAYGVVNAVSLYVERGHDTFHAVHVEAAARVGRLAQDARVERLVHVSGIGADPDSDSEYIRARGKGEGAVRKAFPNATIIRPAVMFGPDDAFLTTLIKLVRSLPVFPMFGNGRTKLQPVYVEDVAEAIARVLDTTGQEASSLYEFGGPQVYTYEHLVRSIADQINARTRLVPMPFAAWDILARAAEFLPGVPLTRNQIALMRYDTIPSTNTPGLANLHLEPTAIESIIASMR